MGIGNSGVSAEAAIGRHDMGCVADEEDAPAAIPIRDVGTGFPSQYAAKRYCQIRVPDSRSNRGHRDRVDVIGFDRLKSFLRY